MSKAGGKSAKQSEIEEQRKKIMLSFQQMQMLDESNFNESFLIIKNLRTGSSWESPKFYFRMFDLWSVEVDGFNLQLELNMRIKTKFLKVAYTSLEKGTSTIYLQQLSKPGKKFCVVTYDLEEISEQPKKSARNHFQNNSDIFNSFLKDDDISRVSYQDPQKKSQTKTNQDERVVFHGQISIISQGQQPSKQQEEDSNHETLGKEKQKVKNSENQNQNWHNESSDQKRGFINPLDDSVSFIQGLIDSFPNDKQGQQQRQKLNNTPIPQNGEKQKSQLSKINQNAGQSQQQQYITTSQKWYAQKFNKKSTRYRKKNSGAFKIQDNKNLPNNAKAIQVTQFDTQFLEKEFTVRQMTEMSVEQQIRLRSIDFSLTSEGQVSRLYKLSRFDGNTSSLWYTAISLPNEGTVMVQCLSEEGQLNGCLGSEQIKKGSCPLYDDEGNIIGNFSFKCKSVCNYVVQTQEFLQSNNQSVQILPQGPKSKQKKEENKVSQLEVKIEDNPKFQQKIINAQMHLTSKSQENRQFKDNILKEQQKQVQQKNNKKDDSKMNMIENIEDPVQKLEQEIKKTIESNPTIEIQNRKQPSLEINNPQMNKPVENVEKNEDQKGIFLRSGRKQSYREQKLQKTDVFQMTIENNRPQDENSPEDLNELKKTVRQSRLNKYETNGSEQKKQNHSFTSPTGLPGASIKLETIDSKQISKYPLQVNDNSLQPDYNGRSSNVGLNYMSSLSHRPPKYNYKVNQSYDSKQESSSHHYDNSRDSPELNHNQSIISRSSLLNKHRIDFKIENIELFLVKASYNGKLLKMQIEKTIYHTQTSKGLYILTWQGRGYFFRNVSQYAILHIQFIQQCQGIQMPTGKCKIPLPQLNTHRVNQVFDVEDFIRDDNEEEIGRFKVYYKVIDRNQRNLKNKSEHRKSSSISKALNYVQNGNVYMPRQSSVNPPKKKNIKTHRISTEISSRANDSYEREYQRKLSYLGSEDTYSVFSRLKNKSPVTKRKYTGGNTLIPKASRFVEQNMNKKFNKNDPGPGQYEVPSMFDRHATPL